MFYKVTMKSGNTILITSGSIDKMAMKYTELRDSGKLVEISAVWCKSTKSKVSSVEFEKKLLRVVGALGRVDKKFLSRPQRKRYLLSSQIENGE